MELVTDEDLWYSMKNVLGTLINSKKEEPRVKLVVGVETSLSHVKTCQRNL
jgi:hypothetical protein